MRSLLPVFFFMISLTTVVAQSQLRGAVVDSTTRKPLMEATVSLLSVRDSSVVTFMITNGDGEFTFKNVAVGTYRLLITYVGYRNKSKRIAITAGKPVTDAGTLEMTTQAVNLNEVVVKQEGPPIVIKQDTVEFNAGAFKTQPNAMVENLLKKLPGVEVDRDGTIKAQGQEVKRVLVDGKPFFGDDPKMATRNLPADIIDKVQMYDQQSDQSQFSGIDDGDRNKTINLVTKKDKRKGYFGQQSIGAGPNETNDDVRYAARLNLNRFNGNQQISLIGQANNINQQGFTGQNIFGGGAGLGANFGGGGMITTGGRSGGGGNGGNTNAITRTLAGGLNYRDQWGKKVDVAGSYFLNDLNTVTDQQSRRQYALPDTSYQVNQNSTSRNQVTSHRFNMRFNYQIDSLTTLRITPGFTLQNSEYQSINQSQTLTNDAISSVEQLDSTNLINTSNTNYNSTGNGISGNNNALLMRKFKRKGRTLSLNWNIAVNNQQTDGINQSLNQFFGQTGGRSNQNIDQRNEQTSKSVTNSINLTYTEPLSLSKTLEFHYNYSNNRNTSNRSVNDYDESTKDYTEFNSSLSNNFVNNYLTNRVGSTLQNKRLKYTYALGFDMQQANLHSDNQTRDVSLNKSFTNVLPNAMFTYNFSKNRTLRFNYRSRTNAPSVSQLQPVADNTNPLNIRLGNPDLKQEFSNTVSLNYNNFQQTTFRSVFAMLNATQTNNKIVNATTFTNQGAQTTQPVNTNGYYNVMAFLAIGRRIQPLKANVNLTSNINFNRGVSLVNSQTNRSQNWTFSQGARINSNFDEKLEFGLSGNISYQTALYSLQTNQNTEYFNKSLSGDLYYQLPFRLVVTTDVTYNNYSGKSAGSVQNFALWNVALTRQFFKNRQGELKLQVYDLLNQNRSISRNVTETYTEETNSRVLNRYFMLSFTYNLRRFGSGPQPRTERQNRDQNFPQRGMQRPGRMN
ncbi:outer membrane beta-barrel protein [Larkinella punicea]|uniref:TonB-dependent receptor n=1 Tax=Larkinella punicea TaxID=2315727 RepID=A0A368JVB7_9BACT|nr:outer membrane beta-barrel family protein [Larkinella punicea]RCR70886.1 TonB-dependent receptor [Larkinella punicea]